MIMRIPLLRTVCKAIVAKADWDESKHPRADNGQFGSGSGGSSKPKKPSKTRRKMERREEAASQARVGGAIQSLLSGGSALDKVAWFKQPEPEKPKAKKPAPEKKPAEEPGDSEPSILDTMAQSWSQSEAMRGKVPTLEHPSQRSAREGGPEGGHSPRVLTRAERDYRDSQNQWDNDRRRMGIPVPGDELATLEIPAKPKQPEKPKAEEKPKEPAKPAYSGPIERHPNFERAIRSYAEEMAGTPEDENIDEETLESLTPNIYRQHGKERLYLSGTKYGGYITRDKNDVRGNPEDVGEHGGWYYKLETKETGRATRNIKTLIDHLNEKSVK